MHENTRHLRNRADDEEFTALLNWLTLDDHSSTYRAHLSKRMEHSGSWFLKHDKYQSWFDGHGETNLLYCPGVPGAGKSFMATGVIDSMLQRKQADHHALLYYFFDHSRTSQQTPGNFLATLIRQATFAQGHGSTELQNLWASHSKNKTEPLKAELEGLLATTLVNSGKVIIVIDAMDECDASYRMDILAIMKRLCANGRTSWLLTSRDYPEIRRSLPKYQELEITAASEDAKVYCEQAIAKHCSQVAISVRFLQEIVDRVLDKAGGV